MSREFGSEEIRQEDLIQQGTKGAAELEEAVKRGNLKKEKKLIKEMYEIDKDQELIDEAKKLRNKKLLN